MGPRSVERGKALAKLHAASIAAASMGPRSVERGKGCVPAEAGVTGAASMGPRSVERGKRLAGVHREVHPAWLQWGRVLLNAESPL